MTVAAIQLGYAPQRTFEARAWTWVTVSLLGLGHMAVDGTTIYAVSKFPVDPVAWKAALKTIWLYNMIAFMPQAPLGWLVDRLKMSSLAGALGAAMAVAAGLLRDHSPMATLLLAGIGNALYHVGAGGLCLQRARGSAAMGGLFVGPGSIGVVLGNRIGEGWWGGSTILLAACALAGLQAGLCRSRPTEVAHDEPATRNSRWPVWAAICTVLLLAGAVAARQLVGEVAGKRWFENIEVWIAMAVAASLAKPLAGLLADRVGWMTVGVGGALLAIPVVASLSNTVSGVIAATALVQCAMPVTLAATWYAMPRWPALAFGIPATALALGSLPGDFGWHPHSPWIVIGIQLLCAGAILVALFMLHQHRRGRSGTLLP